MAGKLYATGRNHVGQLGLGDTTQRTSFAQIGALETWDTVRCHAGASTVFAVRAGLLFGWGENDIFYRLGLGNTTAYYSSPQQIGVATDWATATGGELHGLGLRENGDLYAWGFNSNGQHGAGDTTTRTTPQKIGSATWLAIACGSAHSLAIRADGTLWAAGDNTNGQLGMGDTAQRTAWTQVGGASNWVAVAAAINTSYAIRADGTLWAWGQNSNGQLGLGDTTQRTSPTQVGAATIWEQVSAGTGFALAIRTDGTLWSWGKGDNGCTGQGDQTQRTSPTQVGAATDWYAVGAGNSHGHGVKDSGTLWAWGYNGFGGLGLGDTTQRLAPTQVGAATDWNLPAVGLWFSVVSTGPHPVANTCQPEAPITITVSHSTHQTEAPIRVLVTATHQPEAAIAIAVTDGLTRAWGLRVLLDGVAQTRIHGPITVRAEEGAARTASLALRAPAGAVNPIAYTGRTIQIDLLRAGVPLRLFTGRVDLPAYDITDRVVGLSCTDDLQNRVAALTRAEIDALTGGGYHRAVHGEIDDNWDYAQACMMTRPASLDAGPHGGLRVTDWAGLSPWRTYTAADILDETPAIELPRRAEIVNRVDVRYAYRYHRLRERQMSVSWHMSWFLSEAEAAGFQYPTVQSCLSALGGAGWTLMGAVFYPAPASVPYGGGTVTPTGEVASLAATLAQRHGQTVTETHTLTVTAPESIAGNGEIGRELRCTLASEWTPDAWEADITQAPTDAGLGLDWSPDADRAAAEAGMQAALDQAKTLILARHRDTRVSFSLPCTPEIDIDRALALATGAIDCAGKVWAVEHSLDPAAGEAITRVTLALSGVATAGLATPTVTPLEPPAPPDIDAATGPDAWAMPHVTTLVAGLSAYQGDVSGWIINAPETINVSTGSIDNPWYDGSQYPETGFRVALPGVPDSHRAPLEIAAAAAYQIAIPEDALTLT